MAEECNMKLCPSHNGLSGMKNSVLNPMDEKFDYQFVTFEGPSLSHSALHLLCLAKII